MKKKTWYFVECRAGHVGIKMRNCGTKWMLAYLKVVSICRCIDDDSNEFKYYI